MLLKRRNKKANMFFFFDHHVWIIPLKKFAKHFRLFNICFTNRLVSLINNQVLSLENTLERR